MMANALYTQAQTSAQALIPYELMLQILQTDVYGMNS